MSVILPEEHTTTMHPIDTQTPMHNTLTMTLWNANGCNCYIVDQTTNMLLTSLLIFITETWLLSPLRLMTSWQQYPYLWHTT
ncbi:hypothetical protein G6F56_008989 [Rhizopus delemar]|nr:hypothetical protein G6F56_008989 [Rhizopus delemar]